MTVTTVIDPRILLVSSSSRMGDLLNVSVFVDRSGTFHSCSSSFQLVCVAVFVKFTRSVKSFITHSTSVPVVSRVFIHVVPKTVLQGELLATQLTVVVQSTVLAHVIPVAHRVKEASPTRITPQTVLTYTNK